MNTWARSVLIFIPVGPLEIGGGYLMCLRLRERWAWWAGALLGRSGRRRCRASCVFGQWSEKIGRRFTVIKISLVVGALFLGVGTFIIGPPSRSEGSQNPQVWLEERYKEATSVRNGMSRAELMKVFEEDGGLQRIPAGRYVLRSCRMIKVEVEFDVEYGQASGMKPDEEVKIKGMSKPYLEYTHAD